MKNVDAVARLDAAVFIGSSWNNFCVAGYGKRSRRRQQAQ
jgi:hypothetical protein